MVPAIGIEKAAQVFYRANTAIMTATTDFAGAKVATEQAASQLGYTQAEIAAVSAAWEAVGVGAPMPPPVATALSNDVPVTGISAAAGTKLYYTLDVPAGATSVTFSINGASGDADLYVKLGAAPTGTSYDCRPYRADSNETCTLSAQAGTYYVMLKAYTNYSGVTLVGSHASGGGSGGGGVLASGVPVTGISGAAGSVQTWSLEVPDGQPKVTFTTSGGSGNLTLYVKRGAPPSPVAYDCRSQKPNTSETCTVHNPAAGTWYVSLHGVSAYTGVTLVGEI
jgi:hypothetical protein